MNTSSSVWVEEIAFRYSAGTAAHTEQVREKNTLSKTCCHQGGNIYRIIHQYFHWKLEKKRKKKLRALPPFICISKNHIASEKWLKKKLQKGTYKRHPPKKTHDFFNPIVPEKPPGQTKSLKGKEIRTFYVLHLRRR